MSRKTKRGAYKKHRPANRAPRWPVGIVLGGVLLLGLAAFLVWSNQPTVAPLEVTGAPSLKADREQIDLGKVRLGETVNVSFELTNVGDQPLRFAEQPYIEVVAGC